MTEKEIVKQFKSLKNSEKAGALKSERADLMYKNLMARVDADIQTQPVCSQKSAVKSVLSVFSLNQGFGTALRYAVIICVIFFVGMAGCLTTVSASFNSLPGDTLYQIKLATEKMQLILAQDEAMKINLQTEFAGRRIEEITKLVQADNLADNQEIIETALDNFKTDLNNVNSSLDALGSNETTTGTIKIIGQKVDALNDIVIKKAPELSDKVKFVKEEINGIMIEKGMEIGASTSTSENPAATQNGSLQKPQTFVPDVPEAPKKVQWQIIIKE